MSILTELNGLLEGLGLPVETGVFKKAAPPYYVVATPIIDSFEVFADNLPQYEVQEVRLSLFSQDNYRLLMRMLVNELVAFGFTITDRRYIGHEDDTGYHHYSIDVAKEYPTDFQEVNMDGNDWPG